MARTDIFRFSVLVLYEMATGKRGFPCIQSGAELIAQVMRCEPPLDDFCHPRSLPLLVERCLAKDRLNRWADGFRPQNSKLNGSRRA